MSKYQDIMNKVEVTPEMRDRILQNIDKKLKEEEAGTAPPGASTGPKKSKIVGFKKYMPMAATFAILLLGAYTVMVVLPSQHKVMDSASTSEAPAYEAESTMDSADTYAATESAEATEEAEEVEESAAEVAEATEEAAEVAEATEEAKDVADEADEIDAPPVDSYNEEAPAHSDYAAESAQEEAVPVTPEASMTSEADNDSHMPSTLTGNKKGKKASRKDDEDKKGSSVIDKFFDAVKDVLKTISQVFDR